MGLLADRSIRLTRERDALLREKIAGQQALYALVEMVLAASYTPRAELIHLSLRGKASFPGQPELRTRMQHLLARLYLNDIRPDRAEPLLREALATRRAGGDARATAEILCDLGRARSSRWD